MFLLVIFLLLIVLVTGVEDVCNDDDYGTPGDFDFYVFAQSWSATFCSTEPSYPGCKNPTSWQRVNLTTHGLWPSYNTSREQREYPQCCQGGKYVLTKQDIAPVMSDLQTVWPSEEAPSGEPLTKSLWFHEVNKHGSCSGESIVQYLTDVLALSHLMETPMLLHQNIGGVVSLKQLAESYTRNSVVFACTDKAVAEVRTCMNKELTSFIECPDTVTKDKDVCRSDVVEVPAFPSKTRTLIQSFAHLLVD